MPTEADSIPYEPSRLRGERLLVLAPHPDDEVIGCGGLLALHLRERRPVRVVVATDGTAADGSIADRDAYRAMREDESRRGLSLLDPNAQPAIDFLRFPDRELAAQHEALIERLRSVIREWSPDLIAVPSPIEIHPDHLALVRAFVELVQRDELLFAEAAVARVAFYEVSQPIRPNELLDISAVAESKYAAIAAHASQLGLRDYVAFARGLNAYRSMTLPPGTTFAEGFFAIDLPQLRTTPFSALQQLVGAVPPAAEVTRESPRISVVVRTKDRPALVREALASIRANDYPHEVIVVNDGGATLANLGEDVTLVTHDTSRGRSEAANAGARAATAPLLAFLDDDDLFYPEHLATLAAASQSAPKHAAWYSAAVSAFLRVGASGAYETHSRLRLFAHDFDRDLLFVDNFIPLPTLLCRRADFLDLGGFDSAFDLFEDWDFLLRLAKRGDFLHVPRATCEIRSFEGGGSITLAQPEGSDAFRAAKLAVWSKHGVDASVFARAFEQQKRRLGALHGRLAETEGARHHALTNVARLEREKSSLMDELYRATTAAHEAQLRIAGLEPALAEAQRKYDAAAKDAAKLLADRDEARGAVDELQTTVRALYAEIHRLQAILDTIYGSRTWKLHTMVEKMKGRG